jgi:hypothetical protein
MSFLIWLSDLVWEWKLVSWPPLLAALVLLWFSRRSSSAIIGAVAPYVRYGVILLAVGSLLFACVSFVATPKGYGRLAIMAVGITLTPIWMTGLIAAFLVPRVRVQANH